MEAGLEAAHGAQVERKKIEKQGAVGFGRQRNHFSFLILPGVVVNPLQIRGLSAQTGTVVHQFAVNFARRKIDERHWSSTLKKPQTYSTANSTRPNTGLPIILGSNCTRNLAPRAGYAFLPIPGRSCNSSSVRDFASISHHNFLCLPPFGQAFWGDELLPPLALACGKRAIFACCVGFNRGKLASGPPAQSHSGGITHGQENEAHEGCRNRWRRCWTRDEYRAKS